MNYNEFMSKLILSLSLILSLGFTSTSVADGQLSEHLHDIDYSGLSDSSVCSWFDVVPVPEDFINEAKKRGLTCGSVKYSTNNELNIDKFLQREIIKDKDIPENASKSSGGSLGWRCNAGFIQGYISDSMGGKQGCIKRIIPKNAYATSESLSGWKCNSGFILKASSCWKDVKIPKNAYASKFTNEGWACNNGYKMLGSSCISKILIPSNAYKTSNAQGWKCNYSSYQNNGACLKLPANASASNGGGYYCNSGYRKSTSQNACVLKVNVPANAYASGSGWKCNSGFKQSGNSCIEIPDDTIYRAGSGTGFATTYDGHILTNHHVIDGCSQVTVHNKGKSYITTVITQDPKNDLAILISDYKPSKVYTLSTEVYLSDDIYAAGFPFGKRISSSIIVNRGIVSALMGPGDDISKFQIDADINSGNSGGPIVNKKGNAIGIAVSKLNREKALEELGSVPEGFNFAVNSMMAIGLFRSQGIDLPVKTDKELSVKDRNDLFNQGTFYLACGMTTAQYEKMAKTEKVMFTREVFFSDFQGN